MADEFSRLLFEIYNRPSRKVKGSFRLRLQYHGKNYYNKKVVNYYDLRRFVYDLKALDNFFKKLNMVESQTGQPFMHSLFGNFKIIHRTYKRYSLWNSTTNTRAVYNEMIIPEFKKMNAAIAFKKVLLGDSPELIIKVRKFENSKDSKDILLSSAKQIANRT